MTSHAWRVETRAVRATVSAIRGLWVGAMAGMERIDSRQVNRIYRLRGSRRGGVAP